MEVSMTNLPYISAGTEICLEEVKEEKECSHPSWDCKGTGNFNAAGLKCTCECEDCRGKDQPKEEKHVELKSCYCTKCSRERDTLWSNAQETLDAIIKRDQPLTPKDVGMRKGEAMWHLREWFVEHKINWWIINDEEFDRLFQQFLNEYKK